MKWKKERLQRLEREREMDRRKEREGGVKKQRGHSAALNHRQAEGGEDEWV